MDQSYSLTEEWDTFDAGSASMYLQHVVHEFLSMQHCLWTDYEFE